METESSKQKTDRITSYAEGLTAGYVEYQVNNGVMNILHTIVRPEFGGKGIGNDLILQCVELAKEQGWQIKPSCSFAYSYFLKHPETKGMTIMDTDVQDNTCSTI